MINEYNMLNDLIVFNEVGTENMSVLLLSPNFLPEPHANIFGQKKLARKGAITDGKNNWKIGNDLIYPIKTEACFIIDVLLYSFIQESNIFIIFFSG